ncbi:MAG: c-type cytochrome biogenesis protein CcsB [Lachnospiraceae bacterium]|jgi:cytochrome c-type biogenesis protein CcsB|nr:c-type cytochrome biogenesis protein CcsB [Lachnospiraceae bacterium]
MTAERFLQAENVLFTAAVAGYLAATALYFVFFAIKKEGPGRWAGHVFMAAFGLHTLAMLLRGIGAGRLPLTNQYEFATSFAWGISLCYLVFMAKYRFRALGAFVAPVIFLIIGYAAMQSREVRELMPALKSNWLAIHVSTAIISYGAFGVAFGVSMVYLVRGRMREDEFHRREMPDLEKLDMISYRAVSLGFLFLTLVIVTGAIWAERAWGRYWSWDPKETWSLITWIIYALYLHVRLSRGWQGKKAAWFAVVGFICVVFTYIGVNTLIPGIHSYA